MQLRRFTLNLAGVILLTCVGQASAGTLTSNLSSEYTGGDPPEGATPWLTTTFDDGGSPGTIDLTLEANNLTDIEFIGEWLFNLDPVLDPTALSFSTMTMSEIFAAPTINTGVDAYHAVGDGLFALQILFANSGDWSAKFGFGDSLTTTISGTGLVASSFDFGSAPAGESAGPLRSAVHIQEIGGAGVGSGWISTPDPSSPVLTEVGLFSLLAYVWQSR